MAIFLSIFISVALASTLIVALLFVTRRRLTRQFGDIQRRLVEAERTIVMIKLQQERDTTPEQLQRVHAGLVRVQENVARRFGALAAASAGRSPLSELQLSSLQQWSAAVGSPLDFEKIESLARMIDRAEAFEKSEVSLDTPDLVAQTITLLGRQSVAVAGASAESLSSLLPRVFSGLEVRSIGRGDCDVLLVDAATAIEPLLPAVKAGGLLVVQEGDDAERPAREFPGFEFTVGEWKTTVYRKHTS